MLVVREQQAWRVDRLELLFKGICVRLLAMVKNATFFWFYFFSFPLIAGGKSVA